MLCLSLCNILLYIQLSRLHYYQFMCFGNLPLYVVTSVLKKILEVKNANFYLLCVVPSTLKEVHRGRCHWEINFIRGKVNRHTWLVCITLP